MAYGRRLGQFSVGALPLAPARSALKLSTSTAGTGMPSATHEASCESQIDNELDTVRYCIRCGSRVSRKVPSGDGISRHICRQCGYIHYINPTVVVGCIANASDGRVLMCRRGIAPRLGYWTFPSGFLECGESGDEGARRETLEEAQAEVCVEDLLAVIDVPQINQVHLVYRGTLIGSKLLPTAESSEVALVAESDIPWASLAFTSVGESLHCYFEDRRYNRRLVHRFDLRAALRDENSDDLDAFGLLANGPFHDDA